MFSFLLNNVISMHDNYESMDGPCPPVSIRVSILEKQQHIKIGLLGSQDRHVTIFSWKLSLLRLVVATMDTYIQITR